MKTSNKQINDHVLETVYKKFGHQASGASELFHVGENKIAKPCNPHENCIYKEIQNDEDLRKFTAGYYGTVSVPQMINHVNWRYSQTPGEFIILEDITANYGCPCVLDVKMGRKTFSDKLSIEKVRRGKIKCQASTAKELGYRMSGLMVWQSQKETNIRRNKIFGKHVRPITAVDAMKLFLSDGIRLRWEVIEPLLKKLEELRTVMANQTKFNFLASSILLVYDGRPTVNYRNVKVDVKIIDFDHTSYMHEYNEENGFVDGIDGLIKIFREIKMRERRNSIPKIAPIRRRIRSMSVGHTSK